MFLYGRPQHTAADDDTEQLLVAYQDDGLQLTHITNFQIRPNTAQQQLRPDAASVPAHTSWVDNDNLESQSPRDAAGQDLWGDLQHLTQAALLEQEHVRREPQHVVDGDPAAVLGPQQRALQEGTAAVLNRNKRMLASLLQEQQQQPPPAHTPANASTWHTAQPSKQQGQRQQQGAQQCLQDQRKEQAHRTPAPTVSQLLAASQSAPYKQPQQKQKQDRRKSILYSTPQQPAPKKRKATFSIKDTTPPATAHATQGQGAAAGDSSNPLAALLGSSATPARLRPPAAAHDSSTTPHGGRVPDKAALFATPRLSTTKGSRLTPAMTQAGTPAAVTPPSAAAAAGISGSCRGSSGRPMLVQANRQGAVAGHHQVDGEELDVAADVVPAALFSEQDDGQAAAVAGPDNMQVDDAGAQQHQQLGNSAAAAAATGATPTAVTPMSTTRGGSRHLTPKGTGERINPLECMSAQRHRDALFLQSLPVAAKPVGSSNMAAALAEAGGRGVAVAADNSLAKVMQRIQAAQKEQQDQLAEAVASGSAAGGERSGPRQTQGMLDVQIVSKAWEAHMVKCLCKITCCEPPQQQQQQPGQDHHHHQQQQQQHQSGQQVYLFVQSKTSHTVDLSTGAKVRLHAPWYEIQQQPGQPPVLLAYLLSAAQ